MKLIKQLAVLILLICSVPITALGQSTGASSIESIAPKGDVLRPGHLGRQTGDIEKIIHFYHDLLGTGIRGERHIDRPFWTSEGLIDFANSPKHAEFRAVILPIPGTSDGTESGTEMAIEAIEFRNIERHQYVHNLHDIGSSHLVLILSNLDETMEKLKVEGVPVITAGGEPIDLSDGSGRNKRGVIVRDPDGYPVELIEYSQAPEATGESNILGARISLTVKDLDTTVQLYKDLIGPEFKTREMSGYTRHESYNDLRNTPGAEYRVAAGLIPGSPVLLEFVQYRNIEQRSITPILQDIGVAHVLFMVKDMDVIMPRLRSAGLTTLATSGKPVFIAPTVHALFTTDPNNFFIEFMARLPEQPGSSE